MEWQKLFSTKTLERGRKYFQRGAVSDLTQSTNKCSAKVKGSLVYSVNIFFPVGNSTPMLSCTCPHSLEGNRCKHMAAVFFAIDRAKAQEKKQATAKTPAKAPEAPTQAAAPAKAPELPVQTGPIFSQSDEYRYFNIANLTQDLDIQPLELAEARQLLKEEQVTLETFGMNYSSWATASSQAAAYIDFQIREKGRPQKNLSMVLSNHSIVRIGCSAYNCGYYYRDHLAGASFVMRPCKHAIAALILADQYIQKHNPGDATDQAAESILARFEQHRSQVYEATRGTPSTDAPKACVQLEPRVEINKTGEPCLSFRVGTDKLYVIKNISDFVSCVDNRGEWQLGKSTSLKFSEYTFTEASQEYYTMMQKRVLEGRRNAALLRSHYLSGEDLMLPKANMRLYGELLDSFFDMTLGQKIPLSSKWTDLPKDATLRIQEGEPKLTLYITPYLDKTNTFHGVHVYGDTPFLLKGVAHQYCMDEQNLHRISHKAMQLLDLLLPKDGAKHISFQIGRNNLADFYHSMLPELQTIATIEEESPEIIEANLPPAGKITYFLDAQDGNVFCNITASYGDAIYSVLERCDDTVKIITEESRRDFFLEAEAMYAPFPYFKYFDTRLKLLHCDHDEEAIFALLDHGVQELMQCGEVQTTPQFQRLKVRRSTKISVGVSVESDLLELQITTDDLSPEELLEILYSYQKKKSYHRLKNGDFLRLQDTGLDKLNAMLDMLQLSPEAFREKLQLPLYRSLYLDSMLEQIETVHADRDKTFKNLMKDFKTVGDSDYEVPQSLRPILRNYQKYGYKWLRTVLHCHFGGILADDMGLGKTLQMIAVLLALKEEGEQGVSLVVAPASLVYNWVEEFARFAPELAVCPVVGTRRERQAILQASDQWDVLVTSYDLLKRDIGEYQDLEFLCHILDEAQYIKNHSTAASKSVKIIRSRHRLAMTGTPIENRLSELWSIFDFLMPGFLYAYETFRKDLETPITKSKDEDKLAQLRQMVQPFILRRLKQDVLKDLPEKMEEVYYLKMEKTQQQLYDAQVVHMKQLMQSKSDEELNTSKLELLAELTRIRQLCCDPSLLFSDYTGESAKRSGCMELLQSAIAGEHKVLVFSQFRSMLELLEEDLQREGISYYKITGETPKQSRLTMVNAFNKDQTPVFLISLKAGGVGLNLTGADVVIHYDPWWNLAAQNQATDRAHRIGQTKIVSVYKLIVKGTIEEKILNMQQSKLDLAEGILSGETTGGLMDMSREELLQLFS